MSGKMCVWGGGLCFGGVAMKWGAEHLHEHPIEKFVLYWRGLLQLAYINAQTHKPVSFHLICLSEIAFVQLCIYYIAKENVLVRNAT